MILDKTKLLSGFLEEKQSSILVSFENNWHRIMAVVEKIESLQSQRYGRFLVTIKDDCCLIQATNSAKSDTYSKSYCTKGNKLNSVYNSCLMFVEWYNNNKIK